jgi:hypothetical protein
MNSKTSVVMVADLYREENMKISHTIPLGTLVEVDLDYSEEHGARGFVVEHSRDCDGEPLYAISLKPLEEAMSLKEFNPSVYWFAVSNGWTADCLRVIR